MANPRRLPLQGDIGYEEEIAKFGTDAFGSRQNAINVYLAGAKKYNEQMADKEAIAAFGKKDYVSATPEEVKGIKVDSLDQYIEQGNLPPVVLQYVRDDILNRGIRNGVTEVNVPNFDKPLSVDVTNGSIGNINVQKIVDGRPYNILFSSNSGKLTEQGFASNEGGGFTEDLLPLVLAGIGANYFAGSGLFSPSVSLAEAGAVGSATVPTAASYGGILGGGSTALTGGFIPSATAGAGLLSSASGSPLFPTGQLGAELAASQIPTSASYGGILGGGSTALTGGIAPEVAGGITASTIGQMANSSSIINSIASATGLSPETISSFAPSAIQGLLSAGGSYLQSSSAKDAAETQANAQIRAAQIAADAARFRPVGVTTRFGSSNFQTDAAGNVIGAGYTPSAEILGYQNRLSTLANQGLTGAEQARTAYAPLTGAAQNLFSLGQGYLAKTPEQAAQEYIAKQTALLTPSRENQLAELRNRQFQTGRGGAATAQGGNLMATNPEMAAYYNSIAQSDLVLAAQADQEARNRITYGSGLFDTGANLQGRYYSGQTAAYSPFATAMDTSSGLERLAQQPLDLSTAIGSRVSTANANVGQITGQGIINAANTMAPANAYSLGGNVLAGVAGSPNVTGALNRAFGVTAQPTQQQFTFDSRTGQYIPVAQSIQSIYS